MNIIEACVEHKVKRLIYTSSPSVVFDGVNGIYNGDESLPYPTKVLNKNQGPTASLLLNCYLQSVSS